MISPPIDCLIRNYTCTHIGNSNWTQTVAYMFVYVYICVYTYTRITIIEEILNLNGTEKWGRVGELTWHGNNVNIVWP